MKPCIGKKEYNRFLDDSLSDEQLAEIEAHLRSCGQCKKEFESWKQIKVLLSESKVKVPENLKTKVMSRILEESILPGAAPLPLNRIIAAVFLTITLGFYFQVYQGPFSEIVLMDAAAYVSELLYNLISFFDIDISFFGSLLRNIAPILNELLLISVISTLTLIAGFFLLISKGMVRIKSN